LNEKNRVDSSISFKRTVINSNSNATCKTCNGCLISSNHDDCVVSFLKSSYLSSVKMAKAQKLKTILGKLHERFSPVLDTSGDLWEESSL
jgi:hypothetical protein